MKKALNKDILREIAKTKSKFLSLVVIMFLGVFVFVGLKETTPTMINTYNKTLEDYNMYDIRVKNDFGISTSDLDEINKLSDIQDLEQYYIKNYKIENTIFSINIESLPEKMATPKVIEGRLPEENNEVVLVDSLKNTYHIGDDLSLVDDKNENKKLSTYKYKIVGFVYGADHIEISSNNLANKDYFAYIKKENFVFDNATGVNIKLRDINYDYSDENYTKEVNKRRDSLVELLKKQREVDETNYKNKVENQIAESEKNIQEAKKNIEENSSKLELLKALDEEGYNKPKEQLEEAQKKIEASEKELTIARKSFEEFSYPRFNVETIRSLDNYAQFIDSASSLSFVANIFSIFLFAVSILVSLTTLSRMIDENRTNIGTLKALGYKNREISKKYYIYGAFSTIIGTIFGLLGGYLVIVPIIYNSYARFFTLKIPSVVYSSHIIILSFVIALLCIVVAIYIPLRKILNEKSAYLLRPKSPRAGSRIFLEKITFIWRRLTFLQKVTLRNIFRYKVRMFMTVFGVLGCLALMFIGFAIRFGVMNISDEQFKVINKIDIIATYNPYISEEDVNSIQKEVQGNTKVKNFEKVNIQQATIENNNDILDTAQLVAINKDNYKDYITLLKGDEEVSLPEDGVAISEKLAYLHNLKIGDSLKIVVNDKQYEVQIGEIVKNYFGHTLYMNTAYYEKVFSKEYSANSFIIKMSGDSNEISKEAGILRENSNIVNVVDNSDIQEILDNFIEGIDIIVVVMVLCSVTLALVVLYNLINVNVSERIRELSTIKVLGFYPKEVTIYVFREIFYLGAIGIILGSYLAYRLYLKIILELAARQMMFSSKVPLIVYILSIGITILIIVLVMIVMHRRLRKINMVEALKAVE